jgi:membrane-bound lytic murein transglycosylase B
MPDVKAATRRADTGRVRCRVLGRVVPVLLGALLVSGTVTSPARADDVSDARAQAAAAADHLAVLQSRIERAQAAYATALASVGQRVIGSVAAHSVDSDATRAAESARAKVGSSARALYIDGGRSALVASALDATNSHDLALRLTTAARVMSGVRQEAERADVAATQAAAVAARAALAADDAIVTADRIRARADQLGTLLDEAQRELDRLSSRARGLQVARDAQRRLAAARAAAQGAVGAAAGSMTAQLPPATYFALYRAAAQTCPGMPWTLLAAVGQVESGHGRNNGPSSAGAVGPMQFMPATFARYAVDGDHDGAVSPWSPPDAVFTAARYLCVNGGGSPSTVRQALFAYNHAQWYVDLVLAVQAQIAAVQP